MSRILITGSADGLGLAAARTLLAQGHQVVFHARSPERAAAVPDLGPPATVVTGDLSSAIETRALADQVNTLGRMDAVIHNAAVYLVRDRGSTPEGHALTLAVNVLAPYLLTALIDRPERLIYLTSGMHRNGHASLRDIDWTARRWSPAQAYSESKHHIVALTRALARRWPDTLCNAVDPGWVPTKMGGPGASDDLTQGHLTQTWLAVSHDEAARVNGGYWYHRRQYSPAPSTLDDGLQDQLVDRLSELTGIGLPPD